MPKPAKTTPFTAYFFFDEWREANERLQSLPDWMSTNVLVIQTMLFANLPQHRALDIRKADIKDYKQNMLLDLYDRTVIIPRSLHSKFRAQLEIQPKRKSLFLVTEATMKLFWADFKKKLKSVPNTKKFKSLADFRFTYFALFVLLARKKGVQDFRVMQYFDVSRQIMYNIDKIPIKPDAMLEKYALYDIEETVDSFITFTQNTPTPEEIIAQTLASDPPLANYTYTETDEFNSAQSQLKYRVPLKIFDAETGGIKK